MTSTTPLKNLSLLSSSGPQYSQLMTHYQSNLRLFFQKVDEEVSQLISNYEGKIRGLQKQIQYLKDQLSKYSSNTINPEQSQSGFRILDFNGGDISPIKIRTVSQVQQSRNPCKSTDYDFDGENLRNYLNEGNQLSNSRFQIEKGKKKQQMSNLLESLELGRANLLACTEKMQDLLGKNKKYRVSNQQSDQSSDQDEKKVRSTYQKKSSLNQSINIVCQSLDNSFHNGKSNKKKQQKRKQKQKIRQTRLEQARNNYKTIKQQGLKNLLQILRTNVTSGITKIPALQSLKSLKITNSAYEIDNIPVSSRKQRKTKGKSSVLIDPTPIAIEQNRNINRSRDRVELRQPKSILKYRNNNNILSNSLLDQSGSAV